MNRALVALAGLMGAAGVALAAAAAHGGDPARLQPASAMLLFHAPAVVAAVLLAERAIAHRLVALVAACAFVIGAALFAGDLASRHYADRALFPMAAPAGGTLLIAGWIALAIAAILPSARPR